MYPPRTSALPRGRGNSWTRYAEYSCLIPPVPFLRPFEKICLGAAVEPSGSGAWGWEGVRRFRVFDFSDGLNQASAIVGEGGERLWGCG